MDWQKGSYFEWPARSPDLTVCDTFLWSYLNDQVFTPGYRFENLNELRNKIETEIQTISPRHLTSAFHDWEKRIYACAAADGYHFE